MGTWGTDNFQNDSSLDWIGDLLETADSSLIEKTFGRVLNHDDIQKKKFLGVTVRQSKKKLPGHLASEALAAGDIVAARFNHPPTKLPKGVAEWLEKYGDSIKPNLIINARDAITRIKMDSELRDLWEEGDGSRWRDAVDDLDRRLETIAR